MTEEILKIADLYNRMIFIVNAPSK